MENIDLSLCAPENFCAAVEAYLADCEDRDLFPDYAGLCLALGLSRQALEACADPAQHENAAAYAPALEKAALRRESWLARAMAADSRRATGCMNLLRQKENGGYADRAADSGEKSLKLLLQGVGGWDAFQ